MWITDFAGMTIRNVIIKSAFRIPQSAIPSSLVLFTHFKSAIRNPQSAIP